MPTLLMVYGFRFFFYSNENDEPVHVHVTKGNATGKIWLEPDPLLAYSRGFSTREEKQIMDVVQEHKESFKNSWNEYFAQ